MEHLLVTHLSLSPLIITEVAAGCSGDCGELGSTGPVFAARQGRRSRAVGLNV